MNHNNYTESHGFDLAGDKSFKFLPYQLSMVGYWPTMALKGNGELGFDSGEGAWETATSALETNKKEPRSYIIIPC